MPREEAIDIIRKNIQRLEIGAAEMTDALNELVPELRESEEETTRKELLDFVKSFWADHKEKLPQTSRWVTYLEKQKEQKPRDYCSVRDEFDLDGNLKQKPAPFNEPYNPDDYEVVMEGNATSLKRK